MTQVDASAAWASSSRACSITNLRKRRADKGVTVTTNEAAHRVDITVDGQPFTSYLWGTNQRKPVLYPLISPDGITLTRGYPL